MLICDEVLSALDVSVQANILELLAKLRAERDVAMLFISHDLAVVRSFADRVGVLFGGELMSVGPVERIYAPPYHPYTLSLLEAVPRIDVVRASKPRRPCRAAAAGRETEMRLCRALRLSTRPDLRRRRTSMAGQPAAASPSAATSLLPSS